MNYTENLTRHWSRPPQRVSVEGGGTGRVVS